MRLGLSLLLLLAACGDDSAPIDELDSGVDSGGEDQALGDSGNPSDAGADRGTEPDDTGVDGAMADQGIEEDTGVDAGPERRDIVVAFGWQGLRSLSIDEGQTWCETGLMEDPHDDLFRGGTFANGLFIGAHAGESNRGAIIVSENGYEWTALHRTNFEPDLPENPSRQWYGGVAFGNGTWLAAGGCGRLATSPDGRTWTSVERFTDGCTHIRSLAFGDGRFVAGLDGDVWYTSEDGLDWEVDSSGASSTVVWDGEAFRSERRFIDRGLCMWGDGWEDNARIFRSENEDCSDAVVVDEPSHSVTTIAYGSAPASAFEGDALPADLRACLGL